MEKELGKMSAKELRSEAQTGLRGLGAIVEIHRRTRWLTVAILIVSLLLLLAAVYQIGLMQGKAISPQPEVKARVGMDKPLPAMPNQGKTSATNTMPQSLDRGDVLDAEVRKKKP